MMPEGGTGKPVIVNTHMLAYDPEAENVMDRFGLGPAVPMGFTFYREGFGFNMPYRSQRAERLIVIAYDVEFLIELAAHLGYAITKKEGAK